MTHLRMIVPLGFAMLTISCAASPRSSMVATIPEAASRPCKLHTLPEPPTIADLEIGYVARGADLVACDLARQLAVDTLIDVGAMSARPRD